jgi:hypothetical protein
MKNIKVILIGPSNITQHMVMVIMTKKSLYNNLELIPSILSLLDRIINAAMYNML